MTVPCHTDTPALQRILSILSQQEGLTARQISGLAYVSERTLTCGGYLKTLRTAGLIYIAGWTQTLQGGLAALYSAGRQPDQPRTKVARQPRHSDRFERIVRLWKNEARWAIAKWRLRLAWRRKSSKTRAT